jgi:hypothetical protein
VLLQGALINLSFGCLPSAAFSRSCYVQYIAATSMILTSKILKASCIDHFDNGDLTPIGLSASSSTIFPFLPLDLDVSLFDAD